MDYPLPGNAAIILTQTDVHPGDVLLGYSAIMAEESQSQPLGYSHAAIALSDGNVLDASSSGVRIIKLDHLLDEYEHLAVLTATETWWRHRLQKLEQFALAQNGKKFNMRGMLGVPKNRQQHSVQALERLERFFAGHSPPEAVDRDSYFCSELIVCAFIDAGIIDDSASIVLSPGILSPSDIGRDKAFGFFRGYVLCSATHQIPQRDYFRTSL